MLDLVIVGGGPAGLSTALHVLAAAPATKLVVLEKERYPREKICAGAVAWRALRILERIGVEVDCPRVVIDALAVRVAGARGPETIVVREPRCAAVVRRIEFDHAFARAAIARGVDVRDGCAVERITIDDAGAAIETAAGTLRARAVVGADGIGGIVRRQAGFPRGELRAQALELDTADSPHDLPRDTALFDFAMSDLPGYAWDFPTQVAGAPFVCRGVYLLRTPGTVHPRNIQARIAEHLAARGLTAGGARIKQFAERGWEAGAEIAAPRVLLVGEAAGIDIATGEGIGQAIEYGAVAGPYLARALDRGDLGFGDWRRTVAKHHLGRQLELRLGCYRAFYSRRRPMIERVMPRLSALFRLGVQDFAGVSMSKLAMLRGAAQFMTSFAPAAARSVL